MEAEISVWEAVKPFPQFYQMHSPELLESLFSEFAKGCLYKVLRQALAMEGSKETILCLRGSLSRILEMNKDHSNRTVTSQSKWIFMKGLLCLPADQGE